jgi:hypothetical protein
MDFLLDNPTTPTKAYKKSALSCQKEWNLRAASPYFARKTYRIEMILNGLGINYRSKNYLNYLKEVNCHKVSEEIVERTFNSLYPKLKEKCLIALTQGFHIVPPEYIYFYRWDARPLYSYKITMTPLFSYDKMIQVSVDPYKRQIMLDGKRFFKKKQVDLLFRHTNLEWTPFNGYLYMWDNFDIRSHAGDPPRMKHFPRD